MLFFHPYIWEMIQFDYCNMFLMGWFNHQLDNYINYYRIPPCETVLERKNNNFSLTETLQATLQGHQFNGLRAHRPDVAGESRFPLVLWGF